MVLHLGYVWEKLHLSVLAIADGEGSLTERIANAYVSQFIRLDHSDLSQIDRDVADEIQDLLVQLRRTYREGEGGRIVGDLHEVNDSEARRLVERLVSVYDKVCRLSGPL